MPTNVARYARLAEETAVRITGSYLSWTDFLNTAARLYKYPYHEQLLIYAQRPEATACASFDIWNQYMGRYIRRGAKGIALIDSSGDTPKLKYVFDVSDTGGSERSRSPNLWTYRPEHEQAVSADLEQQFSIPGTGDFAEQLEQIVYVQVTNYFLAHQQDILGIVDGSGLEGYHEYDKGVAFINAAAVSVNYTLFARCGLAETSRFAPEDFAPVLDFNTPQAVSALGSAVSQISEAILRTMEVTIKRYDRAQQAERSVTHGEQSDLHTQRGLLDSRPGTVPAGDEAPGQVREDAQTVPAGAPSGAVEQPDPVGAAVSPSGGDRGDGEPAIGADDAPAGEGGRGDGGTEGQRPDEMGGSDEQPESPGGRSDPDGTDLRLTEETPPLVETQFSFFPTEAEQIESIAEAERAEPAPSAFSFTQEEIDHVLRLGGNTDRQRERIVAAFEKQKSTPEIAAVLQQLYHGGNGIGSMNVWYDQEGIRLSHGESARYDRSAQVISWSAAAERIGQLLETGQFATNIELAEAEGYERRLLAEQFWNLYHDFSEEARVSGYLESLSENPERGFPEQTAWIAEHLKSSEFRTVLAAEFQQFHHDYKKDRWLLRFHYHKLDELLQNLQDLDLPRRTFSAEQMEVPSSSQHITQDEIDAALSSGSGVSGGKGRIFAFFQEGHTDKEKANFLKHEHGIGGRSHALSGATYSEESHDSKGMRFKKQDCPDISLSWEKVSRRITDLIRKGRYLTEQEQAEYDKIQEEKALAESVPELETVGRIEYPGTNGEPGEIVAYTDAEQFVQDIREETYYGAPITVVLYRDEHGQTIPQDFLKELDPPPKGLRVEDAPVLENDLDAIAPGEGDTVEDRQPDASIWPYNGVKGRHPDDIVLYQMGDFFEIYGEDAKVVAPELGLQLVSRTIPTGGRVEMCGFPANRLEQVVEQLRDKHDVTVSAAMEGNVQRREYSLLSIDHEAEQAINAREAEFGADGTRVFRDAEAETAPRYEVVVYHHFENGFDERGDYQTLREAEEAAEKYVDGSMEPDGFAYDGAAVYDLTDKKYLRIYGDYPDEKAHAQVNELTQSNDLQVEMEAWQAQQASEKQDVVDALTEQEQTIVRAMETAGFLFDPQGANPGLNENLVFTAGESGYPVTFQNWEQAYAWIDAAELRDTPGLREQVQQILHPAAKDAVLSDEEFARDYLVPGETTFEMNGRTFMVDRVNENSGTVNLQDITFVQAVGFPIFRVEPISAIRQYLEPQQEIQPQQPNSFIDHYYVVEDLQVRGALQLKEYSTFGEAMTAYRSLPTDRVKALGVQNTRTPLPGSLDLIQCKDGHDTLIRDYERVDGWQNPEILELVDKIDAALRENRVNATPAENYVITNDNLGTGGQKEKFWRNIKAIATLKQIEREERHATPEEQHLLSQYVGWGGLADAFDQGKSAWATEYSELKELLTPEEYAAARSSTLNAHYTSPTIIRAIYDAVGQMGFQTGNILEPAMGIGNFFGVLPEEMKNSRLYGVELDSISGRIARQLYPNANITIAGFETTDRRDFYDLAIGNVPFGDYKVNDRGYNRLGFSIHNYFLAKSLDQLRPGGVAAFVTSRYTMDAKNPEVRRYLGQRAELLGAIRLPNTAFKANAGAEVVSDILFLQKRDRPMDLEPDWVHLGQTEDGYAINSYFLDHPEMVLGKNSSVSTAHGMDYTVQPLEDRSLGELLQEAVQHIQGSYREAELPDLDESAPLQNTIPADPEVKNYSYTVVEGEVYYRENSIMVQPDLNATAKERVKGMVNLRRILSDLITYQLEDYPDTAISDKQQELNAAYDQFTAKFGLINTRANALAFSQDSSYYLLCSLEILDEEKNLKAKADIFTKRTIRPERQITSVDTPAEALAVSIGEHGKVDLPFMAQLLGTPDQYDDLISSLQGVIFRDPLEASAEDITQGWHTADDYLSGNVRAKLKMARMAAQTDSSYSMNVSALEKAKPKDLDASEIDVRLGATWLDKTYVQQFMVETFDTPYYLRRSIQVHFAAQTAEWNISGKTSIGRNDVAATVTYGTERASAYRILEDTLNLRDVRIYDTIQDADGKEKRVLNKSETTLAQQKQQAIKDAFRDWIWKDARRRETLVTQYNELFNSQRPREFDGSHIHFVGMNPEITLREHQRNAIAHVLYGGNTLLAHEVGAGKSFEMAASAMESKRLGLCQKSMFVVPNHLILQWSNEFLRLYPNANLLVTTEKDFAPDRRKKFCARIATGDYDAVIIGHSQFEKIPISAERQERLLQREIDDVTNALDELKRNRGESFSIKQMEKTRKSLQARLEKLNNTERKDDVITFEQLGVDRLFVDESQSYKNLFLYTKMRNIAGLSTSEAQRSSDMFMKCRYLDEITGGRGVVFASGTPVSNSMTELYTLMRYLQYNTLQQKGLSHFDAWASTFGETVTAIELAPEGTGYRARTRFAKFFNLPELMSMFKEVADIKTSDQLHLPVPDARFETVVVQPSSVQKEMVTALSDRAAKVHSGMVDPSEDNMLRITSDGRKIGLDQRLMNPMLPDDPGSKVNACVEKVLAIWKDGQADRLTQMIFCDMSTPKGDGSFNVYDDIRSKLIAQGVPEKEIAFIHTANTDAKKKELFAKVRSGQVRILMGSTQKMGAGTNAQDRLIALHHLDVGWRPSDMTQRNGRIIRQGNQNKEVQIYQYVTEGTFDAYIWQTLENKQKFISQIMTSKSPVRACEDVDEQALSYAEVKALCAGNPLIKEKMDLDIEVSRLKVLKADHQSKQYRLEDQILKVFPAQIEQCKSVIQRLEMDIQTVQAHPLPKEGFVGIQVGSRVFDDKQLAGAAILAACKACKTMEAIHVGSYRGFEMELSFSPIQNAFEMSLKGAISHRVTLGTDARGNLIRMDNTLAAIPDQLTHTKEQLSNVEYQMEAAKAELGKPFPQAEELTQKSSRLAELDAQLNMADSGTVSQEQEKPKALDEIIAQATAAAAQENSQRRQNPQVKRETER